MTEESQLAWDARPNPDLLTVVGAISDILLSPEELDEEAERQSARPPIGFIAPA